MRGRAFLLIGALSGCGLVSGLDDLEVVQDASTDAASATDSPQDVAEELATDAGPDGDAASLTDAASIHCGTTTCSFGQTCCVSSATDPYAYTCGNACQGAGYASLSCDDPGDCTGNQICCFSGSVAQCTLGSSNCGSQLCASPQQCGNGMKCAPFDAGWGLSLSRCQ